MKKSRNTANTHGSASNAGHCKIPKDEQSLLDRAAAAERTGNRCLKEAAQLHTKAARLRETRQHAEARAKLRVAPVVKFIRGEEIRDTGDGWFVITTKNCFDRWGYPTLQDAEAAAGLNDACKHIQTLINHNAKNTDEVKFLTKLRKKLAGESLTYIGMGETTPSHDAYFFAKPCGCVYRLEIKDSYRLDGHGIADGDHCATHAKRGESINHPNPVAYWKEYVQLDDA